MSVFFFKILPKGCISRFVGQMTRTKFSALFINWFIKKYNVNTDEIEYPENGFHSFNHFFTRKLKKGIHHIDREKNAVVSPVDGRIDECGPITGTRIMQAKNLDYLVSDLIPSDCHHLFIDGFFITLYLSPADYHRIHSPLNAKINELIYAPGKLFPVKEVITRSVARVFSRNERMITLMESNFGRCAVCKIGAMNVGRISVNFDTIESNKSILRRGARKVYGKMAPLVRRGDEIGRFNMGSTVIMLFEKDMFEPFMLRKGESVRVGQKLGTLKQKEK
ncbi:MAG: archaetidylserine decarboxylase [Spirochaetes bacterium]|jgi:phosphatidylserine decarboxylase|nr:archaetidylserine decarboxylase [Spirochaetota bacterium]